MGYDIYWNSDVQIAPPLSDEHLAELKYIVFDKDPRRSDVFAQVSFSPDVEEMHRRFHGRITQDTLTWELDVASDSIPDLMEDTRWYSYDAVAAFKYLIENFFKPRGYTLEGDLSWSGEAAEDRGVIYIEGEKVEPVEDTIDNPGPSWKRKHVQKELSSAQVAAIRQVLRFALDRSKEFDNWLSASHAGVEADLRELSSEAIGELVYHLLNDHFS